MELLVLASLLFGVYALGALFDGSGGGSDPDPTIEGTKADDLIQGSAGADVVNASEGDDVVIGGTGSDSIQGGRGQDLLLGEQGDDTLDGGTGSDLLIGGKGNDVLFGRNDQDILIGGSGDDLLYGGTNQDVLVGTSGSDTLYGGAGGDRLSGYDIMPGTSKADALANNLVTDPATAQELVTDLNDFVATNLGNRITPELVGRVKWNLENYDGTDLGDDVIYGGDGNDSIYGDFNDTLTGDAGDDVFFVDSTVPSDVLGTDDKVTITDFNPATESLRIFIDAAADNTVTFTDAATPALGVIVFVGGAPVAQLQGLTAAQVPNTAIEVVRI
jgi:Ca2+-binding RTX toxin-like protein